MVAAGEIFARNLAEREWRSAVTAAVLKRADLAAGITEQHDLLIEESLGDWLIFEFMGPERRIPAIAQEHVATSSLPSLNIFLSRWQAPI
jgi:hypothetical protein